MFCKVTLVRREGVLLPRWQLGTLVPIEGSLVVRDENLPELSRHCKVARLAEHHKGPKLFDVVLLGTNSSWMTLAGFERVDLGGRWADYAQTWLVEPVLAQLGDKGTVSRQ